MSPEQFKQLKAMLFGISLILAGISVALLVIIWILDTR